MIGDAGQHVPQVAFRIDSVQFSRSDQAVQRRGAFSTTIGPREKKILSSQSHDPQRSFRRIIVDFDVAVITEGPNPIAISRTLSKPMRLQSIFSTATWKPIKILRLRRNSLNSLRAGCPPNGLFQLVTYMRNEGR